MRRLLVVTLALFACACGEEIKKLGIVESGPTSYESLRVQGPSEVKIGETVQYRSFARLLGSNQETETTATAGWFSDPVGRLTIAQNGSAVGASEGTVTLSAIILGGTASMNVNVIGASATGEVTVNCPSTLRMGDTRSCTAAYLVNGVSTDVTNGAAWSSSAPEVASMANSTVIGVGLGTAFISAKHESSTGRAQVTVVADGSFDTQFVPAFNACGVPIRTTLTGSMYVEGTRGDLSIGGANQIYNLTIAQGADGRIRIAGQSSAGGFEYALEVTQVEPRGSLYTGKENIIGPGGCIAQYTVTMVRK